MAPFVMMEEMTMSRKARQQGKKKKILILCGGESESVYLNLTVSAYNVDRRRFITIERKIYKNLEDMEARLEDLKPKRGEINRFDEIHLICDKEKLSNKVRQISYNKLKTKINELQKSFVDTELKIIASFPSFEFPLLLHFPIKDAEFSRLHDDKELKTLLSKQHKNYAKGDQKWMEGAIFSKEFDANISRAINRSEKIKTSDNNSWTDLFKTVKQIINNSSGSSR